MPYYLGGNADGSSPTSPSTDHFDANCSAGIAVFDIVRVVGVTLGVPDVDKTDPTDKTKMPGHGLVVDKPTAITCRVQMLGESDVSAPFSLTPGARYFVGPLSTPVTPQPTPGVGGILVTQAIGFAVTDARLLLNFDLYPGMVRG